LLCFVSLLFLTSQAQISSVNNTPSEKEVFKFLTKTTSRSSAENSVTKRKVSKSLVPKTLDVATAGTLKNLLTSAELSNISHLTLSGSIDASDFKIMRDSMPSLSVLDINAVNIMAYSGANGTGDNGSNNMSYPANQIPENAFYVPAEEPGVSNSILTSIVLPSSATSIGAIAFAFCDKLNSISIPSKIIQIGYASFAGCNALITVDNANPKYSSADGVLFDKAKTALIQCPVSIAGSYDVPTTVTTLGMYSFFFCDKLTAVAIPSTVKSIVAYSFTSCSATINVDANNPNYSSLDGVLYNKSVKKLIQCGTSKVGSYVVPATVDSLGDNAFYNCSLLTAVTLPSSISFYGDNAFFYCSGLTSITVSTKPVSLSYSYGVFEGVNLQTCTLNVPFATKQLYMSASVWNKFANIVENPNGFTLGANKLILQSVAGSNAAIKITTVKAWTVSSNQSWLTVKPENGVGNDTIIVTAEANELKENRTAVLTVSAEGVQPQTIQVTQSGIPQIFNLTPGGLSASMTAAELSDVINLKITGTIDARDFKTMRDSMPKLAFLDISEVTIAAYNGAGGTSYNSTIYAANRVPNYAFNIGMGSQQFSLATLKLPTTINAIGDYAFYSCDALTEIIIPNSVTYIGPGGFGSCNSLMNVVLPNQLTSIESQAFYGCAISSIIIPNTVKTIANTGFGFCRNLSTLVIPNSITRIDNSAFEGCTSLTDLTIGNSVTYIGNSVFSGCSSLQTVVVPNSVKTLDGFVFANCTNLKSVTLPNSLATIGYHCFYQCTNLPEITIPNSVTKIEYSAFSNCTKLNNVVIPESVTYIGSSAFADCTALTGLTIGESVTTIDYSAFYNCSALTSLTIPNSVNVINGNAFSGCVGLKAINVDREVPLNLSNSNSIFQNVNKTTCTLNVPLGTKNQYAAANQWKDFNNIVENIHGLKFNTDSVKLLSDEGSSASINITANDQWTAVSNQTWLKVSPEAGQGNDTLLLTATVNASSLKRKAIVTISTGLVSKKITVIQVASPKIVNNTAGGLVKALTADELNTITNLTISGAINARDFKIMRDSMPNLETLDISSASIEVYTGSLGTSGNYVYTYPVNEIPQSAFFNSNTYKGKTNLNSIILPATATSIGSSAFQNCSGLNNIDIPNSVTSIGGSAFERCIGLTDIKLSNSLKSITNNTFQYCSGLNTIEIPISVKTISDYAFQYCTGLTSIAIPDSVSSVSWYSFDNCTNLTTLTLGKSVSVINYGAFRDCTSLKNIVFNNSIKTIGDNVFSYTAITDLKLPETVTSIGYSAFSNCADLLEVQLPNSLTIIGSQAFSFCTALNKITFGNALTTINSEAFYGCTSITSIDIPESVSVIESSAFYNCSRLMSISVNSLFPVDLTKSSYVFKGVDYKLCTLNVPYQTKALYSNANQWMDFENMIENPYGLKLDVYAARLSSKAGSNIAVNIFSNTDWTVSSNQQWLTASAASGNGNKLITITADENATNTSRTAIVTVSAIGLPLRYVTVTQAAAAKTIQVTAGGLFTSLSTAELSTVSNLILTGTIDARDFKTMRNNMPLLTDVDLSGTTILAYTGTEGTVGSYTYAYPSATIPIYGFWSLAANKPTSKIISVVLPASAVAIGSGAFHDCSGLFSVKLPETLTSIGEYAFQNCSGLREISLPNSLLSIGASSFSGCKGLIKMKFGNSLTTINNSAFEYCASLRSLTLPNSISTFGDGVFQNCNALVDFTFGSAMKSTGNSTFRNCSSLKSVVLPNSITTIGISAYQYCTNLADVSFGNALITIGNGAFESCSKLDNVIVPNTVTTIDFRAFMSCTSLKNINLSNSLTTIGGSAFWSCTALTDIVIPNAVITIGDGAFSYCSELKNVKFGSKLTTISGGAFSNCYALEDVVLPNTVTTVGIYAFTGCGSMKSITIPAGIMTLGYNSISCSGLTAIYSLSPTPITLSEDYVFSSVNKSTCVLYVPKGSKAAYQALNQWKEFSNISEDFDFLLGNETIRIKSGGSYSMDFPTNKSFTVEPNETWLKANVVLENGINKIVLTSDINPDLSLRTAMIKITVAGGPIKSYTVIQSGSAKTLAVSAGNLLASMTAQELKSVSNIVLTGTIDARDFRIMRDSMPQLADIDMKDVSIAAYSGSEGTNSSVGSYPANETPINAFYVTYSGIGHETLTNVILPDNLKTIGKSSFAYANGIKSIVIPDQVTLIGETAFARCEGLKDVVIGQSVTNIGVEAFYICTQLSGVAIPNSVTTISAEAFSNCIALKWVTFPNGLTTINGDAFSSCRSLTSVELPNTITTLEDEVFYGCKSLTKANIPNSITDLKYGLFYSCSSLKEITIPASVKTIGPRVFGRCSLLTTISIPASVTKMDYGVFEFCIGLTSIYAYPATPLDLSASYYATVFNTVNKATCKLYVPAGSKALYAAAIEWKDFANIIEMTTALPKLTNSGISIYPNPVKDVFRIDGLTENAEISIVDLNGKLVKCQQIMGNEKVSIGELSQGVYLVRITTSKGYVESKLLKK